jgi:uncharacterized membrane protein (DUF485 family)
MPTSREHLGIRRRLRCPLSVLKILGFLGFLGFTAYVADVATTATGPAIDIGFDIAVYVALVVHITRNWLDRRADRQ